MTAWLSWVSETPKGLALGGMTLPPPARDVETAGPRTMPSKTAPRCQLDHSLVNMMLTPWVLAPASGVLPARALSIGANMSGMESHADIAFTTLCILERSFNLLSEGVARPHLLDWGPAARSCCGFKGGAGGVDLAGLINNRSGNASSSEGIPCGLSSRSILVKRVLLLYVQSQAGRATNLLSREMGDRKWGTGTG